MIKIIKSSLAQDLEDSLSLLVKAVQTLNIPPEPIPSKEDVSLLDFLGIPHTQQNVTIRDLCDLLNNEVKLKNIVSKMHNKAFW